MDQLFKSVALIQKSDGDRLQTLLRWEPRINSWKFIVADRLNKESFRESVAREVAWQLNLDRKTDFLVSNMAQLSMEYVETNEDGSKVHVAVAFYHVHLYRKSILERIAEDSSVAWASASEICEGKTLAGQEIDPAIVAWINKWTVIQPWQ